MYRRHSACHELKSCSALPIAEDSATHQVTGRSDSEIGIDLFPLGLYDLIGNPGAGHDFFAQPSNKHARINGLLILNQRASLNHQTNSQWRFIFLHPDSP
jgi:hypothetical protein